MKSLISILKVLISQRILLYLIHDKMKRYILPALNIAFVKIHKICLRTHVPTKCGMKNL